MQRVSLLTGVGRAVGERSVPESGLNGIFYYKERAQGGQTSLPQMCGNPKLPPLQCRFSPKTSATTVEELEIQASFLYPQESNAQCFSVCALEQIAAAEMLDRGRGLRIISASRKSTAIPRPPEAWVAEPDR